MYFNLLFRFFKVIFYFLLPIVLCNVQDNNNVYYLTVCDICVVVVLCVLLSGPHAACGVQYFTWKIKTVIAVCV